MGVVYHANYLSYFEIARTEFIRARGLSYAELDQRGDRLVVVDAHVRYHAPARYDDELSIETRLVETTAVRLRFEYEIRRDADEARIVTGSTVLASVGHDGRPRRMSAELREACDSTRRRSDA